MKNIFHIIMKIFLQKILFSLSLILLIGISNMALAQLITENGRSFYQLGHYRIYPEEKVIEEERMFGTAQRDSFGYFPVNELSYDTTALIFIERSFHFKEYLPFIDASTLETLYPEKRVLHLSYISDAAVYIDSHRIYYNSSSINDWRKEFQYDLPQNMQRVHSYLWQDTHGTLHLIPQQHIQSGQLFLRAIDNLIIDIPTFTYVAGNFYTDKNGLYWLAPYHWQGKQGTNIQLEQSDGKTITPQVTTDYIIYGEAVYSLNIGSYIYKLDYYASDVQGYYDGYTLLNNGDAYEWMTKISYLPDHTFIRSIIT